MYVCVPFSPSWPIIPRLCLSCVVFGPNGVLAQIGFTEGPKERLLLLAPVCAYWFCLFSHLVSCGRYPRAISIKNRAVSSAKREMIVNVAQR